MSEIPQQHLATLYKISRQLNSSLDLQTVLEYVMDQVIAVAGAERGFLMLRNDKTAQFDFRVARGIEQKTIDSPKFHISRTIVERVAESGEPLLTDNAQDNLSEIQSVVAMALRSILCVPIKVRDEVIGVAYVDNRIHIAAFDKALLDLMVAFASQAGIAIENARLYQIAIEQGRLERELEMAHQIQYGLLPSKLPYFRGYEVATYWESAQEVAGDFYDCFLLDSGVALGVVIADVSGKGVPAALFMAVARSLLRGNAAAALSMEETLSQANELIMHDAGTSGMFVTVYYSRFELGGRVIGVNGGHNQPLLWRARDGSVEWLPRGGRALGWFPELPVQAYVQELQAGDILVFYTDGFTEAEQSDHTPFGEQGLVEVLQRANGKYDAEGVKNLLVQAVHEFTGEVPPFDDRTVVVVRYTGE